VEVIPPFEPVLSIEKVQVKKLPVPSPARLLKSGCKITVKIVSRFIFIPLIVFSLASRAQTGPADLFEKQQYSQGNQTLPYRLLRPADARSQEKFPLVLFLHGAGERGTDNEAHIAHITELFSNTVNRRKFPCYVVAPQCPKGVMWVTATRGANKLTEIELVIGLLDKIERELPIDRNRIYITGLSMGGFGTWDLLARFPHRFAAAIPICGGGDPTTASRFAHVPIWAFHGSLDETVRPRHSRTMIRALQEAGGKPGYTEFPEVGHDSWVYAYREPYLMPWLFAQRLEKNTLDN
jgi:predicted peptidase